MSTGAARPLFHALRFCWWYAILIASAGDGTTLKQMTTTLTLKADDLLILLNSMEAEFTDYMSEEELAQHDKMYARLSKALQRLEA